MIKKFIDKVGRLSDDAWTAILTHIDKKLEEHDEKIKKLEKRLDNVSENFDETKAVIDSQSESRKLIKKTVITGTTGVIIAYILRQFGIF